MHNFFSSMIAIQEYLNNSYVIKQDKTRQDLFVPFKLQLYIQKNYSYLLALLLLV